MSELALLRSALRLYAGTTMVYGFTRSVTYDYQSSRKYYNAKTCKYEHKEMLLVDKIGRIAGGTFGATVIWPGMLAEDMTRLECAFKGKDRKEYEW